MMREGREPIGRLIAKGDRDVATDFDEVDHHGAGDSMFAAVGVGSRGAIRSARRSGSPRPPERRT
jgi:hypothetical protein